MKKKTKWLVAIIVSICVLGLGLGSFFFYNLDARFMEAQDIPTGMNPEDTMLYYYDAWDRGDYKTMEKMWLALPNQIDSLWVYTRGVWSVNVDSIRTIEDEENRVQSQEGFYDAFTIHVDYFTDAMIYNEYSYFNVWYLVKEKEGDDWRIVESGNL